MSMAIVKERNTLGVTLLVTGCCIGAGMIGMPVVSAMAGFFPATLAMLVCYFFATGTGLLLMEATLWFDEKVNLLTMANFALGKAGKAVTWILFLFLFYCLFVAYIDGGGQLIASTLTYFLHFPVGREVGIFLCVCFVGVFAYAGTAVVSKISRFFLVGLGVSYCAMLSFGLPHVHTERLFYANWTAMLSTLPIFLICFGYQNLVPTLVYYVKRNTSTLRTAILVGNLIPFLIYFLWNFVILGLLPDAGSSEFKKMMSQTDLVTELLGKASESSAVLFFATTFSFFAVLTPFMANTLSFVDFLKDGLKISKETKYDLLIYGIVLFPPMVLTLFYPHLFLKALGIAGGFADVILFGIIPVLIVWTGRYVKKIESSYTVAGGKGLLILILMLSIALLLIRQ